MHVLLKYILISFGTGSYLYLEQTIIPNKERKVVQ